MTTTTTSTTDRGGDGGGGGGGEETTPPHRRGNRRQPSLPPDHPALAYVDDASALLDLIRDEPDLFLGGEHDDCRRELEFLRDFVRDFADAPRPSRSTLVDDHVKGAIVASGDDCDGFDGKRNVESGAGMDVDEDLDSDGRGDDDDYSDGRAMEEDGEGDDDDDDDEEGGYWDDDDEGDHDESTVRDRYVWPPPPPPLPSSFCPDGDADVDSDCDRHTKEEADDDDGNRHDDEEDDVEAYECVVIGAGAAGVGVSVALIAGGMKRRNMLVIESKTVGSSFDSWPPHTRFISPSVYSNPFGQVDLNAVDPWSSPAFEALSMRCLDGDHGHGDQTGTGAIVGGPRGEGANVGDDVDGDGHAHSHAHVHDSGGSELEGGVDHRGGLDDDNHFFDAQHLSGRQYAEYLRRVASRWSLPVRENCTVAGVRRVPPGRTDSWKFGSAFEIDVVEEDARRRIGADLTLDRGRRRRQRRDEEAETSSAGMRTGSRGGSARSKVIYSRFVIWCGGEWSHPNVPRALTMGPTPRTSPSMTTTVVTQPHSRTDGSTRQPSAGGEKDGTDAAEEEEAEVGYVHYSRVGSTTEEWRDLVHRANAGVGDDGGGGSGEGCCRGGDHVVVVGAFEAGVDATCTLVELGVESVTVVEESCYVPPCWVGAVAPDSTDTIDGARDAEDGSVASGNITSQEGETEVVKEAGRIGGRGGAGGVVSADPSVSLSSSSAGRIRSAIATGRVTLLPGRRLVGVDVEVHRNNDDCDRSGPEGRGGRVDRGLGRQTQRRRSFVARVTRTSSSTDGVAKQYEQVLPATSAPVVLCTGFDPGRSCPVLASLVDWDSPQPPPPRSSKADVVDTVATTAQGRLHRKHGSRRRKHHGGPLVSEGCDESLRVPGVFVCGPMLRHTATASASRQSGGAGKNEMSGDNRAALHCSPWRSSASRGRGHSRGGTKLVKSNTAGYGRRLSNDGEDTEEAEDEEEEQTIIFCFIYKFRTRFALVAGEILSRLVLEDHCVRGGHGEDDEGEQHSNIRIDSVGHERLSRVEEMLRWYQEKGMLLKDLSCATCEDVLC